MKLFVYLVWFSSFQCFSSALSLYMGTGNSFGKLFRITTFGESHGPAVGVIIDGCPPNVKLETDFIQYELNRRKPGQSRITTPRKEDDLVEIMSGLENSITTGTPISALVRNFNQRGQDYQEMVEIYRPSHADATYDAKYGIRSVAGGGRSSARETIGRVIGGAVAKTVLKQYCNMEILGYVKAVHNIVADIKIDEVTSELIESNIIRCPNEEVAKQMIARIDEIRRSGDSVGGVIELVVRNVPSGIGSPVFDKIEADLAKSCLSLPAAKGFEVGSGFAGTLRTGSEHNDPFYIDNTGRIRTVTNNSGGIQGGITNGEDIILRVAFKPTATVSRQQQTVTSAGDEASLRARGRHDPCVLPRAVPLVESMVAITLLDSLMQHKAQCGLFPRANTNLVGKELKYFTN